MSKEPPTLVTDQILDMNEPALIAGLKYILTSEHAQYSFIVKSVNDNNEIVEEHHVKAGDALEESELNLLVGTVLHEFKERGIKPSTDHDSLKEATEKIIKDLSEDKPE